MMKYTPLVRRLTRPTNAASSAPIAIATGKVIHIDVTPCSHQDCNGICARAKEGRMTKADHSTKSNDQIEAGRGQRKHQNPRRKRNVVVLAGECSSQVRHTVTAATRNATAAADALPERDGLGQDRAANSPCGRRITR